MRSVKQITSGQLAIVLAFVTIAANPALAHHPLNGLPMQTFTHGMLSGVGHPVLGFDHLFFILAAGMLAVVSGTALLAPLFLLAGVVAGVMFSLSGIGIPALEPIIALSLVIVGVIGIKGSALSLRQVGLLFAVLGVFHGWAYGGALTQQESVSTAVLSGYLVGLCVIQYAIAVVPGLILTRRPGTLQASALNPKIACAITTGVGITFLLEHLESIVLI